MQDLLFSGVQPTNQLHIGNYIGSLKQWVDIQHRYRCLFCIVDLHAITVPQNPAMLRANILRVAASYLAVGIDPERCTIFVQSEVPEHVELGWILSTTTKVSELERMTQFKDKAKKRGEQVGVGLFTYPALMAADILLYGTTVVPVGEDQTQHVELTRTLARRFNAEYGETFTVPQLLIQKMGARIMSLDDPSTKMSKSGSDASKISLTDEPDAIRKKLSRAVTDSDSTVIYDTEKKPAIANLMTIYHHATGKTMEAIQHEFSGQGYGTFKAAVADAVISQLTPIQARIKRYLEDPAELNRILDRGRDTAQELARKNMSLIRQRVGLGRSS